MNKNELIFVIANALQKQTPPSIKNISVDGDNDSSEIIIDTNDGQSFVIKSKDIKDYDNE